MERYGYQKVLKDAKFEELHGKTLTKIEGFKVGSERIVFHCKGGEVFALTYYNDCCAGCSVEEIFGDLEDLINSKIVLAEVVESNEMPKGVKIEYTPESFTWAFYKLRTNKGTVTIRWYGSSNGYYSETASFEKVQVDLKVERE